LSFSQGPLSSIRAAIKRTSTRTSSQSDHSRERRRPEITILSAEPLATNAWFPGASGGFPPPPPPSEHIWGGSIPTVAQPPPSYDEVIREKTQEQAPPPAAAPRVSTTTIATQTDFLHQPETSSPQCSVSSQAVDKKGSVARRPPKPPRPSFPFKPKSSPNEAAATSVDSLGESPVFSTEEQTDTHVRTAETLNSLLDTSCEFLSFPLTSGSDLLIDPCEPCLISLDEPPVLTAESSVPPHDSNPAANSQLKRPTPRPRSKPITKEVKVQTLVRFRDDGESAQLIEGGGEISSGKYLQELLDIFGPDDQSFLSNQSDQSEQSDLSDPSDQSEEDIMSTLRNKIQAFEKQAGAGEMDTEPVKRPEPRPRVQHPKPPATAAKPVVPTKPSLAPRPSDKAFWEKSSVPESKPETNNHKEVTCAPTPAPRPLLPKKSAAESKNKEEPAKLARPSRPAVAARPKKTLSRDEGIPVSRPPPPVQSKATVDLIDLDFPSAATNPEQESVKSIPDDVPPKHDQSPSPGTIPDRPSVPQKPTVIRVPSKIGKLCEADSAEPAPPLPAQKPVGGLPPPAVAQKPSLTSKPTAQTPAQEMPNSDKLGTSLTEKSRPPRPPGAKVVPPRPPPAKGAPGRPPPPQAGGTKRPQGQGPPKKGPALPPRPSPGHPLYASYTKKNEVQVPHERTDSSIPECQVSDVQKRAQNSSMKTIAPLLDVSSSSESKTSGPEQLQRARSELQVQVLHDFTPEGPDELALHAGETVTMVDRVDSEWYRGTCRGLSGIFPVNHVKELSNIPAPVNEKKSGPVAVAVSGPRCVARFNFEGEQNDELSFSEGSVIRLKEYVDQEWARGDIDGRFGIFPLNFVDVVEDLPAPVAPQTLQKKTEEQPGLLTPVTNEEAAKSSQKGPEEEEWALALYDFTAQTVEDLSFKQGARILVTEHLDSEWCCGRLDGKEGLFPKAFVQCSGGGHNNKS
ncbi:hypothetical protein JZ751_006051, partial [Albula glossodonta]